MLEKDIGEFLTLNPAKQKNFLEFQKDKPNHLDLAQAIYYSIRNTLQVSFELEAESVEFFPILIRHSIHYDSGNHSTFILSFHSTSYKL